jgi:hypothetical protein
VIIGEQDIPRLQEFLAAGLTAGVLSSSEESKGTISGLLVALKDPLTMGAVPAQSLFAAETGGLCLFSESEGSYEVRSVSPETPRSFEVGVAYVDADYVGIPVILNPSTLPAAVRQQCE